MPVAHVFAQANVRHDDEVPALLFYCTHRLLNHAVLGVRAAGGFVLLARNPEEQYGLQTQIVGPLRFLGRLDDGQLENAGHARDRLSGGQLFADEKREDKIVHTEFRFPNEVANTLAAAQTSGALNQFSHAPEGKRLAGTSQVRRELDAAPPSGLNAISHARDRKTNDRLPADRCQQFIRETGVRDDGKNWDAASGADEQTHGERPSANSARTQSRHDRCLLRGSDEKQGDICGCRIGASVVP